MMIDEHFQFFFLKRGKILHNLAAGDSIVGLGNCNWVIIVNLLITFRSLNEIQ